MNEKVKVESITTTYSCERALSMMRHGGVKMRNLYDKRAVYYFDNGEFVRKYDDEAIPKKTQLIAEEINAEWVSDFSVLRLSHG